jgi:tetratricopeptide (TPR) repeat protein
MADEPKPKVSFLGASPQGAPAPAATPDAIPDEPEALEPADPPEAPPPYRPPVAKASFLQPKAPPAPPAPAVPAPSAVVNAPNAPTAPAPQRAAKPLPSIEPGNRALAEQHLQQGLNFYDAQDVDNALFAYQQCVEADPSFGMGHNNLGMVLIDLERYDEAIDALYCSVRCDADYAEAYNNLGFVLRRMQRPIEAASAYTRFLQLEPDVEEGDRIRQWVNTVLQENNIAEAPPFALPEQQSAAPESTGPKIKKMAAWEVAAGNTETYAPVGILGEVGPVAQTPVQPSQVGPMADLPPGPGAPPQSAPRAGGGTSYVGTIERGMDRFGDGQLDEATSFFHQAIEIDPNNAEGYTCLGKVLIRQERLEEAVEQLQRAVSLDPEDPSSYYVLGFALRALERNVEAAENYQHFLRLMPNALDAERMKQWIGLILGADAVGIVEPLEDAADDEPIVTESDRLYKEALDTFQGGDAAVAEQQCVSVLTSDPGHYRSRLLLGRCYLRQRNYDAAIEQLKNVLVSRPDYPEALYFLGQAYEKISDPEAARQNYQRYMDIAPTGPRAQRVEDWFVNDRSKSSAGGQIQCELCLRFFDQSEVSQHDGKATCANCMAVMGGAPIMPVPPSSQRMASKLGSRGDVLESIPEIEVVTPKARKTPILVMGGLVAVVGLLAAAFFMGYLNPVLQMVGLNKPPVNPGKRPPVERPTDPTTGKANPPAATFAIEKVRLTGTPAAVAPVFGKWSFTPQLEGVEGLDDYAPNWKKTYSLSGGPQGMYIDPASGTITWTPSQSDPEMLKRGESFSASLIVKAVGKQPLQPDEHELFTSTLDFSVFVQFGYELSAEMDLGLPPGDQPSLEGGDFNADGLPDLAVGTGRFGRGGLNLYMQRKNAPFGVPVTLDDSGRFSSVAVGDIDGDKHTDLLGAAWMGGKLRLYKQTGADIVPASDLKTGPGPLGAQICDLDGDGRAETVVTLVAGSPALISSTVTPDGKMGAATTLPLPAGGPQSKVLTWKSATAGPGVLAVLPLAAAPLQFIPHATGAWGTPVPSKLEPGISLRATVPMAGAGGPRLAAITASRTATRIQFYIEQQGHFSLAGNALTQKSLGLNLIAGDFNGDGNDDLLSIELEGVQFYFANGDDFIPGLHIPTPRLQGAAAALNAATGRPDFVLIGENRKAFVLRSVEGAAASPAPSSPKNADGTAAKPDAFKKMKK